MVIVVKDGAALMPWAVVTEATRNAQGRKYHVVFMRYEIPQSSEVLIMCIHGRILHSCMVSMGLAQARPNNNY